MSLVSSIVTKILDLPPSCIELCPWDNRCFAIGTYYLEKNDHDQQSSEDNGPAKTQKRSGSVMLFRLGAENDSVELVQTYPTDYAILDLHFPTAGDEKCVWTANSTGSLSRYTIDEVDFKLTGCLISQLWDHDTLALSFTLHPTNRSLLGATLSDGSVVVCRLSEDLKTAVSFETISTHDLEAWTVSFDGSGERCLSGGDDAALQYNSLTGLSVWSEAPTGAELQVMLLWKNRRVHSAGVTAILPLEPDVLVTGSYDDNLRVITLDKPPKPLAEENLGGGVWRLKLIHTGVSNHAYKYDILASCMHAGTRIVRITLSKDPASSAEVEVLARFEEHESMNYGSAFVRNGYEYTILSTSFYDKRLCLWNFCAQDFGPEYKTL